MSSDNVVARAEGILLLYDSGALIDGVMPQARRPPFGMAWLECLYEAVKR